MQIIVNELMSKHFGVDRKKRMPPIGLVDPCSIVAMNDHLKEIEVGERQEHIRNTNLRYIG